MKYYIIAGEASGDLHAFHLVQEIIKHDKEAEIRGWGGDLMEQAGMKLDQHYKDSAFMGFYEVVANLRKVLNNIKRCKQQILRFKPDALILVDYPGFNLRIADFASRQNFKVYYYIAPKAWAWKQSRASKLGKTVDKLFAILPFEEAFFSGYGVDTMYVGNPLMDYLDLKITQEGREAFLSRNGLMHKPVVALFPGSRKQEINTILPEMLKISRLYKDYQFVIGGAPSQDTSIYRQHMKEENLKVLFNQGQELMKYSDAALITSGTATLEAALLNLPQVICYKGNTISIEIARRVVNVDYIGLANLILDEPVIPELIQKDMTIGRMSEELDRMLHDRERREKLFKDYARLREVIGGPGASVKVAKEIINGISS